jgi:predicted small lipoprotein YifL
VRAFAAAALALLLLAACGKYGPPMRPEEAARARERAEERARDRAESEERKRSAPAPGAAEPSGDEAEEDE